VFNIFKASFRSDPISFILEAVSFVFIVGASITLALNSADPDMKLVYPFFIIGNIIQGCAAYRRKSIWLVIFTCYFTLINILGLYISLTG